MDLVDIREHLKFRSHLMQVKGFNVVVDRLLKYTPKDDSRELKELLKIYFDCYFVYGDTPFHLLIDSMPTVGKTYSFSQTDVFDEFETRIQNIKHIKLAFASMMEFRCPDISRFLRLAVKIPQLALMDLLTDPHFHQIYFRYTTVLLFTKILTDEQKRRLGNDARIQKEFLDYQEKLYPIGEMMHYEPEEYLKICSLEDLCKYDFVKSPLTIFERHRLMLERPDIFKNKTLKSHSLYLPFIYVISQFRKIITTTLTNDPKMVNEAKNEMTALVEGGQDQNTLDKPDFDKVPLNMETFLGHVIHNKEKIKTFLRYVEYFPEAIKMLEKPYALPMLIVLLPHAKEDPKIQKKICDLTVSLLEKTPEQADNFALYFISLFVNSRSPIPRDLVMETLTKFAVNRYVVDIIFNFVITVATKGEVGILALNSLGELVTKYPTIIDRTIKIFETLDPTKQKVSETVFVATLKLAEKCCIATDQNDSIITKISNLLKTTTGSFLAHTINTAYELTKNDVLEVKGVRQQLYKTVRQPGNEKALVAYCRVLSLGSISDSELTDEENQKLRLPYVEELHDLTETQLHEVVSEAWRALGHYERADIEEARPQLNASSFGTIYTSLHAEEQDGFVDFLQKMISQEVETYQRPLYNTNVQSCEVPPLLSKVDSYKDQLLMKNAEDPWFWSATLPLCGSIFQLAGSKALSARRLLKSCLLNVPLSESRDDLLRLMAGWRICVREVLTTTLESNNNDILNARKLIVEEGKAALMEKSESVDNCMMMLTVLAETIEEKLRMMDDEKQVALVAEEQNNWIIPVFEFVATRLPKAVKQRKKKTEPAIYQILTQSNKSSLHIAIFCTRLLYRNPKILNFYGDVSALELVPDSVFASMYEGSLDKLKTDETPNRNMLWITTEAYGADAMTAQSFGIRHKHEIDEKTHQSGAIVVSKLEKPEDIEQFFKTLVSMPKEASLKIQQEYRKVLEKMWSNGTEDVKQKIYEGLGELALVTGNCRKRAKTIPVEKLPDSSVLKGILQLFDAKHNVDVTALRKLFRSLANQKRKDGRFLPPVDWLKIFERVDWRSVAFDKQSRLAMITLACEQNVSEVIFHVAERIDDEELTAEEINVFSEHLQSMVKILPQKEFELVLGQLIRRARLETDKEETQKIADSIAAMQKNPVVRIVLIKQLPTLENITDVTDPILLALKHPEDFGGSVISSSFDLWLEARKGDKMVMKTICEVIRKEEDSNKRDLMFPLLSHESRWLSMKKRFEKILDVISLSRIARSTSSDRSYFLTVILSLIVSPREDVEVPVCWFNNEDNFYKMLHASRKPFIKAMIEHEEMKNNAKHIGSFLRFYIDGEECDHYESWQRDAANDFLLHLIAAFSEEALPTLFDETDAFWKNILNV